MGIGFCPKCNRGLVLLDEVTGLCDECDAATMLILAQMKRDLTKILKDLEDIIKESIPPEYLEKEEGR